jgi:hypothetical protein
VISLKNILPEATAIFTKKPNTAQSIKQTWEAARVILVDGMQAATAQIEAAQQMAPEILLLRIEDRLAKLEDTFTQLSAAILTIDKGREEALGRTLSAVAQQQRQLETATKPAMSEEINEQTTVEEATIEETTSQEGIQATSGGVLERKTAGEEAGTLDRIFPFPTQLYIFVLSIPCTSFFERLLIRLTSVPKEVAHATSEVFSGLKEAAAQTTLASNVTRIPIEEKDGNGNQGEDNLGKKC